MLEVLSAVTGESVVVFEKVDSADVAVKTLKQRAWRRSLASHASDYGSFKTTARCMTIKPWSTIRPWPFKLYSLWSWSFCRLTGSKIGASWSMWGQWRQTSWAKIEHTTKCEFSKCKSNHTPVCGSLERKSQMCTSTAWSWCQQRPRQHWLILDQHSKETLIQYQCCLGLSSWERAPWSCPIAAGVRCQQRPRPDRHWSNSATPLFIAAQEGQLEVVRISGSVRCQQRPRNHRCCWSNASFHSSPGRRPRSCSISGGGRCQQRPRPDRWWSHAFLHCSSEWAVWNWSIFGSAW